MAKVFSPIASVSRSTSTTSARVALPGTVDHGVQDITIRLYNSGSDDMAIAFGDSTVVAVTDGTDLILKAGTIELFRAPKGATYIAAKALANTPLLYITRGEGV